MIDGGRFWWVYRDGRREPVRLTARILAGLQQTKGTETRNAANDDQRGYRTERGQRGECNLPPHNLVTDKTVKELAMQYDWDSVDRFREAIRKHRKALHAMALANGRARRAANMPRAMIRQQNRARKAHA